MVANKNMFCTFCLATKIFVDFAFQQQYLLPLPASLHWYVSCVSIPFLRSTTHTNLFSLSRCWTHCTWTQIVEPTNSRELSFAFVFTFFFRSVRFFYLLYLHIYFAVMAERAGANTLRGGKRHYGGKTLNDNWVEDRYDPRFTEGVKQECKTTTAQQMEEGTYSVIFLTSHFWLSCF